MAKLLETPNLPADIDWSLQGEFPLHAQVDPGVAGLAEGVEEGVVVMYIFGWDGVGETVLVGVVVGEAGAEVGDGAGGDGLEADPAFGSVLAAHCLFTLQLAHLTAACYKYYVLSVAGS